MAEVEQTMAELATGPGTDVRPLISPNTKDNQINFPSWVHNNLNHKEVWDNKPQQRPNLWN